MFDLRGAGAKVTAGDLTPGHIRTLYAKCMTRKITDMDISEMDATDLSRFEEDTFDVTLCMGPLYHILDEEEAIKCVFECLRVTKPNGKIVFSYLNKNAILPYILKKNRQYIREDIINNFLDTGITRYGDEFCFFTDTKYHTPWEIESFLFCCGLSRIQHVASDGLSHDYEDLVKSMTEEEFDVWLNYHFRICEEDSILGVSQHGLIIGTCPDYKSMQTIEDTFEEF